MLNRAARYFSLLDELRGCLDGGYQILEIGSGPFGIGQFVSHPFVGSDVSFETVPRRPMIPIVSSAAQLPFPSQSFDIVISSDVMEHVQPEYRQAVVAEVLRVARKMAVFCFPSGEEAFALDRKLLSTYRKYGKQPPVWLQEHMKYGFPDRELFKSIPDGWTIRWKPNESLSFHDWMMRKEMCRGWNYAFRLGLLILPRTTRYILRRFDSWPSYRIVITLIRQGETG